MVNAVVCMLKNFTGYLKRAGAHLGTLLLAVVQKYIYLP